MPDIENNLKETSTQVSKCCKMCTEILFPGENENRKEINKKEDLF